MCASTVGTADIGKFDVSSRRHGGEKTEESGELGGGGDGGGGLGGGGDGGGGLGGGGEGGGEGGGDGGGEEPGVNAISTVEGITAFAKPKHCQIDFLHGALGPKTTTFL